MHEGDSFLFELVLGSNTPVRTDSVYPIYVQESVLNTDSNFDNSEFLDLERRMLYTTEVINYFAYQFTREGVFVFATNANQYAYTLVRVLTSAETCPSSTQYIQPMTEENLLAVGVQRQTSIPAHSEWGLYFGMLAFFLLILLAFLAVVAKMHQDALERNKSALLEIDPSKQHPCERRLRACCTRCCRKCKKCKRGARVQDQGPQQGQNPLLGYDKEIAQRELTLDDLRMIKNLAERLGTELEDFEGGGKDFAAVLKRTQRINNRLMKISTENKLRAEEDLLAARKQRKEKEQRLKQGELVAGLLDEEQDLLETERKSTQDSQGAVGAAELDRRLEEELARGMGKLEEEA